MVDVMLAVCWPCLAYIHILATDGGAHTRRRLCPFVPTEI